MRGIRRDVDTGVQIAEGERETEKQGYKETDRQKVRKTKSERRGVKRDRETLRRR